MATICIDPGHGGNDPGAVGNGIKEKDYTLKISQYQAKRLREHGFKVVMTRTADTTLSNSTRTARVKNSGAKICVSNHVNAASPSANGVETIHSIYSNGKLANMILDELVKEGFKRRRAFSKKGKSGRDYYFMHRQTGSVETVIVEHGFITNAGDVQKLKNNWEKFAEADVKAICNYMGIKYIPEKKSTTQNSKGLYKVQVGAFSNKSNADKLAQELNKKGYSTYIVRE